MALDERARHHLYLRLEEQLGPEAATTLMEHLPPTGWADVATKRDLDLLRVATKRDLDLLRVATKRDLDLLRVATKRDLDLLRAATQADIHELRADIDHFHELFNSELQRTGDQLRAEFHRSLAEQTRTVVLANIGMFVAMAGVAFAAARLT
jgi:hypothetical protein